MEWVVGSHRVVYTWRKCTESSSKFYLNFNGIDDVLDGWLIVEKAPKDSLLKTTFKRLVVPFSS